VTRVLVVTAVDLEARGLARHLGLERVAASAWPHFRGGALELVCAGPRAAHLEARVARAVPASLVISAGVCGALAPDLVEGDLVVPEAVVTRTARRLATAVLPGLRQTGTLVTVDEIVTTAEQKARLWVETGALACDMESARILEWAGARGLPAAVVLIPVVFPIAKQIGIHPVHFATVLTAAVGIGLFLPPIGVGLLMALRFADVSVGRHFRAYWPYLLSLFVGLLLLILFPELTLFLPRRAGLIR